MKKVDFSNYRFRASQCQKLKGGTIGITEKQKEEIAELKEKQTAKKQLTEKQTTDYNNLLNKEQRTASEDKKLEALIDKKNTVIGLTDNQKEKLAELLKKEADKELPKTMQTELRTIHRAETYNRNFAFTNKYVQKGIQQEDEAITNYMFYRTSKGIRTMFTKNELRLNNEWFSGEPDLGETGVDIKNWKEGWDTKCSWDLTTFPFPNDPLDAQYECQNQVYMDLTGARKWTTVYVLVNGTEHMINNEKMKWFYAFNQPEEGTEDYSKYDQKCREVERMMIFDYDRFVKVFPYHDLNHSRHDWFETVNPATGLKGFDIPLEERIVEKVSEYNPEFINELKERITIAREYLNSL